ncbi:hypothetical protein LXA43DRAFT_902841, partial [Ganoderma leucocontextum]
LANKDLTRIAKFGDRMLHAFAPRLHASYESAIQDLVQSNPNLRRNFRNNAFAAATFNLSPRTVAFWHLDRQNMPWGLCAITALGNYNPKWSGHLILWALRMIVEFPPGATIFIPSAIVPHSNVRLHPKDEHRRSFTAGGLFCWIACDFVDTRTTAHNAQCLKKDEISTEGWTRRCVARWARGRWARREQVSVNQSVHSDAQGG